MDKDPENPVIPSDSKAAWFLGDRLDEVSYTKDSRGPTKKTGNW